MKKVFYSLLSAGMVLAAGCAYHEPQTGCAPACMEANDAIPVMRTMADHAPNGMFTKGKTRSGNHFSSADGRMMAFSANLILQVPEIRKALDVCRTKVLAMGGYVKYMSDNSAEFAVPVNRADALLADFGSIGTVVSLRIRGEDVTRETTDTAVRLENLEKSRKRLLELLNRTGNVSEMVAVEKELSRVTTELERMQAQLKGLRNRVSFVTVSVAFRETVKPVTAGYRAPAEWVNALGRNPFEPVSIQNGPAGIPFCVELPSGFVFAGKGRAISCDGLVLTFRKEKNAVKEEHWYGNQFADLAFYRNMILRTLENRFVRKIAVRSVRFGGKDALLYEAEIVNGGKAFRYQLAVAVCRRSVYTVEINGSAEAFRKQLPEEKLKTMLEKSCFPLF